MVIIWVLFALACGPPVGKKKPEKKPTAPTVKIPKAKKPQKVVKPAPIFQPQAEITLADGKVFEVADFAFYSNHRGFGGGMYYPKSGTIKWTLYLKQGPTWKKIDFAKVKSMTFSQSKSYKWLQIDLVFIDGSRLQGLHPTQAFGNLWVTQVIARFNPLKKSGSLIGRTRGSPLPMRLYRKKKKSGGGFGPCPGMDFASLMYYN